MRNLDATGLMVWGLVIHLICDWVLQNDWMSRYKSVRRSRLHDLHEGNCWRCGARWHNAEGLARPCIDGQWWDRHPAAYVHAAIHTAGMLLIFPWWAALAIGVSHFVIDFRWIVAKWSILIRQTQPRNHDYSIGTEVRIWNDQVFHIIVIAIMALLV